MADRIVYIITESGCDGRAPETIIFASYNESVRDLTFDKSKNKNFFSKAKRIIEVEYIRKQGLAKLDGVHRLILGHAQRTIK